MKTVIATYACMLGLGDTANFGITIDTKATIHDMNIVRYLQLLLSTMLRIPSRLTCTVITLRLSYNVHAFLKG